MYTKDKYRQIVIEQLDKVSSYLANNKVPRKVKKKLKKYSRKILKDII